MNTGSHASLTNLAQTLRAWAARQPRTLWFILALGVVWITASQIEDFVLGFLDGLSGAR
jgi:hypothetical protein